MALNATAVDYLISMDTYVQENTTFELALQTALGSVAPAKLGVGMKVRARARYQRPSHLLVTCG